MLTHSGHFIGDAWFWVEGEVIHCFYLTCSCVIERHTAWDIGHATSRDLHNWTIQPLALLRGVEGEWDGSCPATGSILKWDNQFWMAYTGNHAGPLPTVGLASSPDLFC